MKVIKCSFGTGKSKTDKQFMLVAMKDSVSLIVSEPLV